MGEKGFQGGSWFEPSSIRPLFLSRLSPAADLAVAVFLTFAGGWKLPLIFMVTSLLIYVSAVSENVNIPQKNIPPPLDEAQPQARP